MPLPFRRRSAQASTMLAALLTIFVLSIATACLLQRVTSRLQTAHRSIAWNEAMTTAESSLDMTIADLCALLPDVRLDAQSGISLGVSQLPTSIITSLGIGSQGISLDKGITLSFSPATLTHGGEGGNTQTSTVSIDVLVLSDLLNGLLDIDLGNLLTNPLDVLNGGDMKLIRLRCKGTVPLPGRRIADPEALDTQLRRLTLLRDRSTGQKVSVPQVSREIEVLLKPVLPFQSAIATTGNFEAPSTNAIFDSFNSLTPLTSTNGRYDVTKRLSNGDVNVGNHLATLGARVFGDVRTNGGTLAKTERISGNVNNGYFQPLPLIRTPTWNNAPFAPNSIVGNTTLLAGSIALPARYKFSQVSGNLRIRGVPLLATNVEIWVTGDITGSISIDPGVQAKIYVQGKMQMAAGALVNGDQKAASLQIYGLSDATSTQVIQLALGDVTAAIYAPSHAIRLTGSGDFQGAIAGASFTATDAAKVHFDEGLALNVGPVLQYAIASWIERDL